MTGPATEKGAARLAALTKQMVDLLPDGVGMVMFMIHNDDDGFRSTVASSVGPDVFAPVLRLWLERYDAGEAGGLKL